MIWRDIGPSQLSMQEEVSTNRTMQQAVSIQQEHATQSATACSVFPRAAQPPIDPRRQREGGYMLLAVLLIMALMIIAATIEAPRMVQQMKRDREEEMIHRGTEYARAVKKYYKKFGRYPANLEQLENTNQIRFLRKRYKDPLTKDGKWKLLNYTDIQTLSNPAAPGTPAAGLGAQGLGAQGLGAQGLGAQGLGAQAQGAFGQPSAVSSVVANLAPSAQQPALNGGDIANTSPTGFYQGSPLSAQQQSGTTGSSQGGSAPNLPQGNPQQGNSPFTNTFSLGSSGASNSNQQGSTSPGTNPAGGN